MTLMTLPAHPDMRTLADLHRDLVDWVAAQAPGSPARLEIEAPEATQPAIQLLLACVAALRDRGVDPQPGPHAAALLDSLVDRTGT